MASPPGAAQATSPQLHDATNAEAAKVLALAAGIDGSYPANIQASVATLRSELGASLTNLQNSVVTEFWDRTPGRSWTGSA